MFWLEDNMEWSKEFKNKEFIERLHKLKETTEVMLGELAKQKEQLIIEKEKRENGEMGK
jgi:hypothetical protein